ILLVAGVAALSAVAYFGTRLWAQTPTTGAAAVGPTKVAVVNIGLVFSEYKKAQNFKVELEGTLKPFKDQAETYRKEVISFQEVIQKVTFPERFKKEDYDRAILD